MLRWAKERAGMHDDELNRRFPKFREWEKGNTLPTLKQLEGFASSVHAPIGFLFLDEPPTEQIPIPDFRTSGNQKIGRPSPDLLETIYLAEQRQEWYRDFLRVNQESRLSFIGSVKLGADIQQTAKVIRDTLGFSVEERGQFGTWTDALRHLIALADNIGVLIMVSGVVGSNNYRKLDPQEFRGFAISDEFAPLIFVNGADTKSAQMFTLAHELAHLWLGQSALSDTDPVSTPDRDIEEWCNQVAAELLVPIATFANEYRANEGLNRNLERLARYFKVSTLVILRRIFDIGRISREQFWTEYRTELSRLMEITRKGGGDFYLTLNARVGKRFARALVVNTLEGKTLHRDAFRLLGFSKISTFRELAHSLGVI